MRAPVPRQGRASRGWSRRSSAVPRLFEYAARRVAARTELRATMGLVMGDLVPAGRALDPRYLARAARAVSATTAHADAGRRLRPVPRRARSGAALPDLPDRSLPAASGPCPAAVSTSASRHPSRSCASSTEETGLVGEVVELIDVFDRVVEQRGGVRLHSIQIVYRARILGGELRDEVDGSTDRCAWFALDAAYASTRDARPADDRARRNGQPARRRAEHDLMHSAIGIDVDAPPELVFALARDVERWERLLPTTSGRASSSARADGALVVDFVARRPLVADPRPRPAGRLAVADLDASRRPAGSGSSTSPGRPKGMDVTWRIEPTGDGGRASIDRARLRRRGCPGSPRFVDRAFTRPIAGRTLATFKALAEARRREPVRTPTPATDPSDMTDRRRVWITGIGVITAIGTGRRRLPGRPAGRPLAGQADRPLRSGAVPIAGRGPGRRLRPARLDAAEDRPPARPVQPVRPGRRPAGPRRRRARARAAMARLTPQRIGIYLGSALGGIAYAEEQHERYLERGHPAGGAEPRAGRLRRRGAGQPRDRARRARADPVDRQLVRLGRGRARRGARATCARAGSMPRSPAAARSRSARSRSARSTSSARCRPATTTTPGHGGPAVRRRPRRVRHGRGRGAARPRGGRGRRAPRRDAVRRAARLRRDVGRPPHGPAAGRRPRGGAGGDDRPRPTRASTRPRSTTSTPTRRRRRSATWPRPGRSRLALGERAATVPVSGTKALYGHPLGASGAIEAAICALAIRDGWAPASVNLVEPDPDAAALLPGLLRAGRDGDLPARAVDVVRVRRAERGARASGPWTAEGRGRRGSARPPSAGRAAPATTPPAGAADGL